MADRSSFYYRTSSGPTANDLDFDPPRTRIAVACNRCRRRKIKCSGSVEGASCEGCIRANNAECVFADRPAMLKTPTGATFESAPNSASPTSSMHMQPTKTMRAASVPGMHIQTQQMDRPYRSSPNIMRISTEDLRTASPTHSNGNGSPTFPMSPPVNNGKRHSVTSAQHPYQRPNSAGVRKQSGDQVSNNLALYSQSLIQAQAMQLSGRPAPTVQAARNPGLNRAPVPQAFLQSTGSFQLQPPLARSPSYTFRQNDYASQLVRSSGTPEYMSNNVFGTPDSLCYSPVFQNGIYSANTPELVSSDSINTLDSRSTFSTNSSDVSYLKQQQQMPFTNQPYSSQPAFVNVDYNTQNTIPVNDPNQWTPGVEKIANQWLQFSPQQSEQFF